MILKNQDIQETLRMHRLIEPNCENITALSAKLLMDELLELDEEIAQGGIVKEIADVMITALGVYYHCQSDLVKEMMLAIVETALNILYDSGVHGHFVLRAVNESNFSKLILASEAEAASDHFAHLGIEVEIVSLGDGLMGCYSAKDQVVNGKEYKANKLLKSHKYQPVDENKLLEL